MTVVLQLSGCGGGGGFGVLPDPPIVGSETAAVGPKTAVITATIDPNGDTTQYWMEYGPSSGFGSSTAAKTIGNGEQAVGVSDNVDGLTPSTIYYYRVIAKTSLHTVAGKTQTFTTTAVPLPTLATTSPTAVSSIGCTLNGVVNPNGFPTDAWFEWGKDTAYGGQGAQQSVGDGAQQTSFSLPLTGLIAKTTYHYRAIARNEGGMTVGQDETCTTTDGIVLGGGNSSVDTDGDGLSDSDEINIYGTNPLKADTDGDGLSDGDEVKIYHTDPLKIDTDGDGLGDGDEVKIYHTDPLKADTDGDGLSDSEEINIYHTDPLKADTDGDGLSDGDEVKIYHTDPNKSDTDGDGLSDYQEIKIYGTNPNVVDTDGDGLTDGDEVIKYGTNPLKVDTDNDGLTDYQEVMVYHTDPNNPDTDGDGVNDGQEVRMGTNPLVFDPAFYPDLSVSSVAGPNEVMIGQQITVTATVKNGDYLNEPGAFNVGLYLSKDQTIDKSDISLGSRRVMAGLLAGQSNADPFVIKIPAGIKPGVYYLGAIADVDDEVQESNEGNNAAAASGVFTVFDSAAGNGQDGSFTLLSNFNMAHNSSDNYGNTADRNVACADGFDAAITADVGAGVTTLPVSNTGCFSPDDEVLIIQMRQDAATSNAGTYEFATVTGVAASSLTLGFGLVHGYYSGSNTAKAQVVRVPNYADLTIPAGTTLTTDAYDDNSGTGGVLVFRVSGTLTVNGSIDASRLGFSRGPYVPAGGTVTGYLCGYQGGSFRKVDTAQTRAANDGGGGGGGYPCDSTMGNGAGGGGGYGTAGKDAIYAPQAGRGGGVYGDPNLTLLFLGSAGGNASGSYSSGGGGSGGGVIYIGAQTLSLAGLVSANGGTATGSGGGGSGGSIYLYTSSTIDSSRITVAGGAGGVTYAGDGGLGRSVINTVPGVDLSIAALSGPAHAAPGDTIAVNNTVTNNGSSVAGPFDMGLFLLPQQMRHGLFFDGASNYVDMGDITAAAGVNAITVALWMKGDPIQNDWAVLAAKGDDSFAPNYPTSTWTLQRYSNQDALRWMVNSITGNAYVTANGFFDNKWHLVVGTYDGSNLRLYKDGVLVGGPVAFTGILQSNDTPVTLGSYNAIAYTSTAGAEHRDWYSRAYKGDLDEVAIFNIALSGTDIAGLYNQGTGIVLSGSEPGMIGYWKLDEGTGDTAYDTTAGAPHNGNMTTAVSDDFTAASPQWTYSSSGIGLNVAEAGQTAVQMGAASNRTANDWTTESESVKVDFLTTVNSLMFAGADHEIVAFTDGKAGPNLGSVGVDQINNYIFITLSSPVVPAGMPNCTGGCGYSALYLFAQVAAIGTWYTVELSYDTGSGQVEAWVYPKGGSRNAYNHFIAAGYFPPHWRHTLYSSAGSDYMYLANYSEQLNHAPNWVTDTFANWGKAVSLASRSMVLGPVGSGSESSSDSTVVTIPSAAMPGYYYLGAMADSGNGVAESNEINNWAVIPINLP